MQNASFSIQTAGFSMLASLSIQKMPTIFRLQKPDIITILRSLKPELSETEAASFTLEKLRVALSEWLLLNGFSSLHIFERDEHGAWQCPTDVDCDCCWRFRVGRRRIPDPPIPTLSPGTAIPRSASCNVPRREDQMMYFNGPWVLEERVTSSKKGKKEYIVRSHLLKTAETRIVAR
uniref:Expressed conserved protein n=1 Tax=Panagrellus redivivus TaxID=6233 RepID=A0A7E4V771_PANRE